VLILAPMVDLLTRRRVRWFSWSALALSLAALVVTVTDGALEVSTAAVIDVVVYVFAYFVRLRFMSRLAKSDNRETSIRFFVVEQMVATAATVLSRAVVGAAGVGEIGEATRRGFTEIWTNSGLLPGVIIGLLSQGTGIFGGLILLDRRENTFCVPVNRASSVLAVVVANLALWIFLGEKAIPATELVGAALVVAAILLLSIPPMLERRRRA